MTVRELYEYALENDKLDAVICVENENEIEFEGCVDTSNLQGNTLGISPTDTEELWWHGEKIPAIWLFGNFECY